MPQRIIGLTIFIFFFTTIFAQTPEKIANDYFQIGNYDMALPIYEKLYKKDTNNVEYVYRLGVCHVMLNRDRAKAIPFLEKASKMPKVPEYVWLDLGSAYRYAGQLNKSEECLTKFISTSKNQTEKEYAKVMLTQLKNAYSLMSKPIEVEYINLGDKINSPSDDFFPVVDRKNSWIYYNSARIFNKTEETNVVNVHFSTYKKNRWKNASRAPVVNTAEDNFVVGKSLDDAYIFIKPQQYEVFDDILIAPLNKETISGKATPLPEPINTKEAESGATLSESGDTLIFASNRKGGFGGLDLYIAVKLPNGLWSQPSNLGPTINTPLDEDFPAFCYDGKRLFFASQGHTSMGGYDIFETTIQSDGSWSSPRNLGYPINNFYDNYSICFTQNKRYAYVADVRPEGYGGYDIYQLVFKEKEENPQIVTGSVFKGNKNAQQPLSPDDRLQILVYKPDRVTLVGIYYYNYNTSKFIAALTPGKYFLKIDSEKYKTIEYEFEILDVLTNEINELEPFYLIEK